MSLSAESMVERVFQKKSVDIKRDFQGFPVGFSGGCVSCRVFQGTEMESGGVFDQN